MINVTPDKLKMLEIASRRNKKNRLGYFKWYSDKHKVNIYHKDLSRLISHRRLKDLCDWEHGRHRMETFADVFSRALDALEEEK